ncbi:hypothetical protein BD779DRAFT_1667253 [Infundibulicybe gibba]|nr:hypothetical protein BD779DRAFT_1667253 [Infundibulicybe gibba]
MSSHQYEIALFGEFFPKDLNPILHRITIHSESAQRMHTREIVFEPLDAQQLRDFGPTASPTEPVLLRARKELGEGTQDEPWILYSYLKPESVRAHPEATVRPWATCQVVGDALSFAAALGYMCVCFTHPACLFIP